MIKEYKIKQYQLAGKNLMPLNGKLPIYPGWNKLQLVDDIILEHKGNLGWILGERDLVIDIDPRNGGTESWKKFRELLDLNLEFTLKTAGGGFHIYLSIPGKYSNYSFKKNIKEYPGIDFLTKGSYCVINGSKTEKGIYEWYDELGEFIQSEAEDKLLNFIGKEKINNDSDDLERLVDKAFFNCSEEKVLELLYKLDPSMSNSEWVKVGMALHNWDNVEGLKLWEEWSKGGDNYKEGETEKRWRSFDLSGGVTLGTISYMAKEVDFENNEEEINKIINKIKCADKKTLDIDIFPKLKKSSLSKIDVERIVKVVQDRYKELLSIKLPIKEIREKISGVGKLVDDSEQPEWCKDWVYVNTDSAYVDMNNLRICKTEAFNIINGSKIPMGMGGRQSASKFISENSFIDLVDTMNYLPSIDDKICNIEGSKVLNTFDKNSVPIEAGHYTKEGLEAIELIKKHIKFICSSDENAQILTEWMAHNVQYPGKQILWSPIIQGIQGIGKSFFGELFRMCLGDKNIGVVAPSQVVSDFNGWANNNLVNVLEELRVKGHNRHDAVNSLKPLITDRVIQINRKGANQCKAINVTNYICFTNYKDSIPLDSDDRRWWVIFCPIENLGQMDECVGEDAKTYFPRLFDAVRKHGAEVRKYMLELKISDRFMNTKQAPLTDYKQSMIATEEAGFDGYNEIKDLIEKGGDFYNSEVICANDLFEALLFEHSEIDIKRSQRGIILKKLGFSAVPYTIKYGGKTRRFWTKRKMTNEQIRLSFDDNDLSFLD